MMSSEISKKNTLTASEFFYFAVKEEEEEKLKARRISKDGVARDQSDVGRRTIFNSTHLIKFIEIFIRNLRESSREFLIEISKSENIAVEMFI